MYSNENSAAWRSRMIHWVEFRSRGYLLVDVTPARRGRVVVTGRHHTTRHAGTVGGGDGNAARHNHPGCHCERSSPLAVQLVPERRFGRLLTGVVILVVLLGWFWQAGSSSGRVGALPAQLHFCGHPCVHRAGVSLHNGTDAARVRRTRTAPRRGRRTDRCMAARHRSQIATVDRRESRDRYDGLDRAHDPALPRTSGRVVAEWRGVVCDPDGARSRMDRHDVHRPCAHRQCAFVQTPGSPRSDRSRKPNRCVPSRAWQSYRRLRSSARRQHFRSC